ncbi:putative reverse transcriptase domain-containing protein [Tanacetum coccineum]
MVGTHGSTPEFSGPAFDAAVQRAVDALLPGLTTRLTNEIRYNGAGGSGDQPPTIHTWLERFGKQKPRSFSTATTPVDAKNWIAHIEKIFEVLGCADEFKARLASYKLEGDALNWWKSFKQAKGGETYVATLLWKDFRDIFFLQDFPRSEKQKYEREYHTIRQRDGETNDGIVNTEFTDVAQVSNAARNIEILHERSSQDNKRNRDGDRIRPTAQDSNQKGYDQKGYDGHSYDRQGGNSQKGYTDYASSPPYDTCEKLYPGKACHRVTRACFTCGLTRHMARDCLRMVSTVVREMGTTINLLLRGEYSLRPRIRQLTLQSDHEYQNCLLRFDDKIRFANLLPLEMSDFDIILGMDWLAEHRAPIVCHTNRVIFGDLNNPEFIYLFQFRFQFRGRNFLFRGEEL